ncbi:hypothetical protein LXL04_022843 [Taraxacum kok-saghyz]
MVPPRIEPVVEEGASTDPVKRMEFLEEEFQHLYNRMETQGQQVQFQEDAIASLKVEVGRNHLAVNQRFEEVLSAIAKLKVGEAEKDTGKKIDGEGSNKHPQSPAITVMGIEGTGEVDEGRAVVAIPVVGPIGGSEN